MKVVSAHPKRNMSVLSTRKCVYCDLRQPTGAECLFRARSLLKRGGIVKEIPNLFFKVHAVGREATLHRNQTSACVVVEVVLPV